MCCSRKAAKSMTGKRASRDGCGEALDIYVGNYVTYYVDKKLKLWHLLKQMTAKYGA
jgi:hypothetical protein